MYSERRPPDARPRLPTAVPPGAQGPGQQPAFISSSGACTGARACQAFKPHVTTKPGGDLEPTRKGFAPDIN